MELLKNNSFGLEKAEEESSKRDDNALPYGK